MLLLALDTSTTAITVAVHDGARVVAEVSTLDARAHGERLAPGIREALAAAGANVGDLTHIVCGRGPGPFTGLRVGIVTARVLALVTDASLHGLCSLDALAAAAARSIVGDVLVATDARRKEVYWARYAVSPDSVVALTAPAVSRPADLPEQLRSLPTVGRGPLLYPDLLPHAIGPLDVEAGLLAECAVRRLRSDGDPRELESVEPLYLRRPDAAPHVVAKSALG